MITQGMKQHPVHKSLYFGRDGRTYNNMSKKSRPPMPTVTVMMNREPVILNTALVVKQLFPDQPLLNFEPLKPRVSFLGKEVPDYMHELSKSLNRVCEGKGIDPKSL